MHKVVGIEETQEFPSGDLGTEIADFFHSSISLLSQDGERYVRVAEVNVFQLIQYLVA